jgi:hypothetical protein
MQKFVVLLLSLSLTLVYSCKTKKTVSSDSTAKGATLGKVSFKFKETGCSSVIIITSEDGTESVLIPKDKLDSKFDKDGLEIYFDYTGLRMLQPAGCTTGIPAQIANISVKK